MGVNVNSMAHVMQLIIVSGQQQCIKGHSEQHNIPHTVTHTPPPPPPPPHTHTHTRNNHRRPINIQYTVHGLYMVYMYPHFDDILYSYSKVSGRLSCPYVWTYTRAQISDSPYTSIAISADVYGQRHERVYGHIY